MMRKFRALPGPNISAGLAHARPPAPECRSYTRASDFEQRVSRVILWAAALIGLALNADAAEVSVAVAANFTAPMQKIARAFEQETGHRAVMSFGSTGGLYAQIKYGAPFQLFLTADSATPRRAEAEGFGVPGSRFTYATGKLVLWSARPGFVDPSGKTLAGGAFQRIALANPRIAPYGAAALEVITAMGLLPAMQSKFVQGENVAQTFQFVATGNAELGFVALSQVFADGKIARGSAWIIPQERYSPIRQDAILLKNGLEDPAAFALLAYLKSDKTRALIRSFGYES